MLDVLFKGSSGWGSVLFKCSLDFLNAPNGAWEMRLQPVFTQKVQNR